MRKLFNMNSVSAATPRVALQIEYAVPMWLCPDCHCDRGKKPAAVHLHWSEISPESR